MRRGLAAFALLALACSKQPWVPPDGRWNVLVLVPDTIRADRVSAAGYPRPTTPALDALAREGVLFTQAISAAPRTWQSYTTILTGLYPPHHGVREIGDHPLPAAIPSLGSLFTRHGYETAVFDPMGFLPRVLQQSAHFQAFQSAVAGAGKNEDEVIVERVADFVLRERERPFLAFVRLNGAHWPYVRDAWIDEFEPCADRPHPFNVGTYGIRLGKEGGGVELLDAEAYRRLVWTADPDEETRRHRIAHYDAEVRAIDEMLRTLLEKMRAAGLMERTIVVFSSDHGEAFFEHGYQGHGPRVDDAVMRVPLIVYLPPGHPAYRPGTSFDGLVRTADLLPTLLEAVGLAPPDRLDGVSLVPALRGEDLAASWAYGESGRDFMGVDPELYRPGLEGRWRMARTADWKLVHVPGAGARTERLFDLRADPGELRDVAERFPERVAELRARLDPLLAADAPRPDRELGPEQIEELRELGYVQ
jgi:arylsulfatase A-like enzyme